MVSIDHLAQLRAAFPVFRYVSAKWEHGTAGLKLTWEFAVGNEHSFFPIMTLRRVTQAQVALLSQEELDTYVFNIGMVEMFSYWKAFCSPVIQVEAGALDADQLAWWHKLLINGMGEFFFVNDIDFAQPDFVTIIAEQPSTPVFTPLTPQPATMRLAVPVGGGKDSGLSLELLRRHEIAFTPYVVNPTPAAHALVDAIPGEPPVSIERAIDSHLLELNHHGHPNGHTPFSALLAFTFTLTAKLFGHTHIAVSNERSSNEGNVRFHGQEVNHQYSKTFTFENDFRTYVSAYLPGAPEYFSLMRPLYELQIAKAFAQVTADAPEIRAAFRSCNRGQKTNAWCGECPKCFFAYLILYPFMTHESMVEIFGADLFDRASLLDYALEQLGYAEKKPLECVGTHEESICAAHLSIKKCRSENRPVPFILTELEKHLSAEPNKDERTQAVLTSWNQAHHLPEALAELVRQAVA